MAWKAVLRPAPQGHGDLRSPTVARSETGHRREEDDGVVAAQRAGHEALGAPGGGGEEGVKCAAAGTGG